MVRQVALAGIFPSLKTSHARKRVSHNDFSRTFVLETVNYRMEMADKVFIAYSFGYSGF